MAFCVYKFLFGNVCMSHRCEPGGYIFVLCVLRFNGFMVRLL